MTSIDEYAVQMITFAAREALDGAGGDSDDDLAATSLAKAMVDAIGAHSAEFVAWYRSMEESS